MVKACPTIALTFVDAARWTATALVIWNSYCYRSARRANEHIRLNGVHPSHVIRSVNPAVRRLKSLTRAICLNAAAAVLDGDRALSHDVVDISGMIVPRTCGLADRRLERPGCQGGRAVPQSDVVAGSDPQLEWDCGIDDSDHQEADLIFEEVIIISLSPCGPASPAPCGDACDLRLRMQRVAPRHALQLCW